MSTKKNIGRKGGIVATAACVLVLGVSAISFAGWGGFGHNGHRGGGYGHYNGCGWGNHMTFQDASGNQ